MEVPEAAAANSLEIADLSACHDPAEPTERNKTKMHPPIDLADDLLGTGRARKGDLIQPRAGHEIVLEHLHQDVGSADAVYRRRQSVPSAGIETRAKPVSNPLLRRLRWLGARFSRSAVQPLRAGVPTAANRYFSMSCLHHYVVPRRDCSRHDSLPHHRPDGHVPGQATADGAGLPATLAVKYSVIPRMPGNILGLGPTILQVLRVRAAGLFGDCV